MPKPPILPPPVLPAPVPSWLAREPKRERAGDPAGGTAREGCAAASFRAGAALAHLHAVAMAQGDAVPVLLFRDRLALGAAVAGIVRAGGRARAGELRDRAGFLRPGDRMDPETALFDLWRRAAAASLRPDALARILAQASPNERPPREGPQAGGSGAGVDRSGCDRGPSDRDGFDRDGLGSPDGPEAEGPEAEGPVRGIAERSDPDPGADPVAQAADRLARIRAARPGQEAAALIEADAALARALGWPRLLPLLATGLGRADLALEGDALRRACHVAVAREAIRAARLAADLARRADRLRRVAPRLRAKAADAAIALFLARDAVAPTLDLAPTIRGSRAPMSPRAAARLCSRLVELGVVRELSGRATFRLYGL